MTSLISSDPLAVAENENNENNEASNFTPSTVESDGGGADRDDGLPKNFDVLIVGTGLVESILSAAVSRNGHTVLHIDPREYYGGTWGTFGFDQWTTSSFLEVPEEATKDLEITTKDKIRGRVKWHNHVGQFNQVWYDKREETKEALMKQKRRFNIDLMPKLIAAREDIVQLLITSNVSRYLEFLRVARLQTNLPPPKETKIESIPLSRADIFTSKSLSLVEKRNLVKLIEAVLKPNLTPTTDPSQEGAEQEAETPAETVEPPVTFEEVVKISKASDKLRHMVKSAVTMLDDGFSPEGARFNQEFCSRCRLFLGSIGRYGNQTPFLWTLYGISEICQAFCRLSAVYGGIFILKRHLSSIETSDDGYIVKTEKDQITAKHIVFGPEMGCDIIEKDKKRKEQDSIVVGRAVLITKGGNIKKPEESAKSKGDGIFLYRIDQLEIIEMNNMSQAVPKDYRLLQISFPILESNISQSHCQNLVENTLAPFLDFEMKTTTSEEDNLTCDSTSTTEESAVDSTSTPIKTVEAPPVATETDNKPQVIYGSYFSISFHTDSLSSQILTITPPEVEGNENTVKYHLLDTGVASTDLTQYVSKAREIFTSIYPEEEFLPKAPDCDTSEQMNGDAEDLVYNMPSFPEDATSDNQNQTNQNQSQPTPTSSTESNDDAASPSESAEPESNTQS